MSSIRALQAFLSQLLHQAERRDPFEIQRLFVDGGCRASQNNGAADRSNGVDAVVEILQQTILAGVEFDPVHAAVTDQAGRPQ